MGIMTAAVRGGIRPGDGPDDDPPDDEGTPGRHRIRSSVLRVVVALLVVAAVVVVAFRHRVQFDSGTESLGQGSPYWLALAMLGTTLLWVAGTLAQLGSLPVRPPLGRLFFVQIAGNFANHLMPTGSGGLAVNLRFLRRTGFSRGTAVGALALNTVAGVLAHMLLLAGAIALAPGLLDTIGHRLNLVGRLRGFGLDHRTLWIAAAVILAAGLVTALAAVARRGSHLPDRVVRLWRSACRHLRHESERLIAVARDPVHAGQLWLGSLAAPLLHVVILTAVLRAVGDPLPVTTVLVTYLLVSALSALLPSPGGVGALDVALALGLVAVGVPSAAAVGAVLGYRLITVWLPLLPSACLLAILIHRRVI